MLVEIAPSFAVIVSALFALGGASALARSMERQRRERPGVSFLPRRAWLWRLAGAAMFGAAYAPCVLGFGLSIGVVVWLGLCSFTVPVLAFMLPQAPRLARALASSAPSAGATLLLIALLSAGARPPDGI